MNEREPISYFAETNHRQKVQRFGIKQADRLFHTYVIGQTGTGKSTLLETLARQDLQAGRGFALIDPHGDLVERVAAAAGPYGDRVTYLDATDPACVIGYNPLRRVRINKIPLAAAGLVDTLKKLWPDAWGVRMEHVLRNSLYALLERDGSTLPDILRLYADADYRQEIVRHIQNPVVKTFWLNEFEHYPDRFRAEVVAPIQNKLGALLADPLLYRTLVTPSVDLRFRSLMDRGGVLLVNLAKGVIGEESAAVLGGLLVSTISLAALTRADIAPAERRPFHLFVDEFQTFTTLAFVTMLSELRKYGVGVSLAHQYVHQIEPEIIHAIFGNVGTTVSFRVGPEDAQLLARQFQPRFTAADVANLPNYRVYVSLMIDGTPSDPFSASTNPAR